MRTVAIAAGVLLCSVLTARASASDTATAADVLKHLSGTWKAAEDRTPRTTALDEQVFGRGAMDVRTVTLVISPSGEADLQVHKSVVGRTGKVFAPSLTDVKMRIGDPIANTLGHLEPAVTVTSAEERYLDGDREKFDRAGTRVSLSIVDLTTNEINMQFEPPDGVGGFGTSLTRAGARATSSGRKDR